MHGAGSQRESSLTILIKLILLLQQFNMYMFFFKQNGVDMGFSIMSFLLSGLIIFVSSFALSVLAVHYRDSDVHGVVLIITVIMLMIGIVNFVSGIWPAVGGCFLFSCCCLGSVAAQQVIYVHNICNIGSESQRSLYVRPEARSLLAISVHVCRDETS